LVILIPSTSRRPQHPFCQM